MKPRIRQLTENKKRSIGLTKKSIASKSSHVALIRLPFLSNRRAVSAVISNMILIGVVIIVGFAALAYAQLNSANYEAQYSQNVNSDINKLKESVSFEYVHYNSIDKSISIYFLNCGEVPVAISRVYLSDSSESIAFSMYYKNGQVASDYVLNAGQEGYLIVTADLSSGLYQITLETERDSTFVYDFIV
jgi:hypothetical protein